MSLLFTASQQTTRTTALAGDTEFTIMVRAKINAANATQTFDLISEWETLGRSSFRLNWSNGQILGILQYSYPVLIILVRHDVIQSGFTGAVADRWYHIAATFQNKTLTVYVDGVAGNVVSHTNTTLTPTSATIGAQRTGTSSYSNYMRGELSDYRVYSTALTPEAIQTIATLEGTDTYNEFLRGRWSLMGPPGVTPTILDDQSVNNVSLTTSGIPFG